MNVKSTGTKADNPLTGTITFYQHVIPPLESGDYTVTLTQTVSSDDGKVEEQSFQTIKKFTVSGDRSTTKKLSASGDRFTINPTEFSSHFPPGNSQGEYSNVLPHIVLTRATLPWERSPGVGANLDAVPADVPPWLALFLFDASDPPPPLRQATLLDLLSKTVKTSGGRPGQLPDDTFFPPFPGTHHNELDYGETWDDKCTVIDVPLGLFNAIAPTLTDLKWLGHVREMQDNTHHSETYIKKLMTLSSKNGEPPKLSVIVGNRLPEPGKKSTVHLVSLENYGKYLPDDDGSPSTQIPTVRLVSLENWSFTAVSQNHTFAGLLLNLNKPDGAFTLQLQLPDNPGKGADADADTAVSTALEMGYAPLNHHTRQGDQTVSWYRGPFVPFNITGSLTIPVTCSDAVTRYNPGTGMFDISYAAAWQLGRLLALQNKHFAEALYNWKRGNIQETISSFEEFIIKETLQQIVDPGKSTDLPTMLNETIKKILEKYLDSRPTGGGVK
jgi:hypothetical protein